MQTLPKPLGNNVLVEIINEYGNVAGSGGSQKKGKLIDFNVTAYHLTASAGIEFTPSFTEEMSSILSTAVKKQATVYWEEFANEGQQFTWDDVVVDADGGETRVQKTYAFIAWWRLTGIEYPKEEAK
jgi:hypothetical protein